MWNSQWEVEERHIDELLNAGVIDHKEASKRHRDLQREYRESAIDAAQSAYENEIGNW